MAAEYEVIRTQPYTYLDDTGRVVNGFRVDFRITAYDEVHTVNTNSLSQGVVGPAIDKVVKDRKALGPAPK
jgi:hypothetical protein